MRTDFVKETHMVIKFNYFWRKNVQGWRDWIMFTSGETRFKIMPYSVTLSLEATFSKKWLSILEKNCLPEVLYYVFWTILNPMKCVCSEIFFWWNFTWAWVCQGFRIRHPIKKKVSARGSLLCVLNHFKANETCL